MDAAAFAAKSMLCDKCRRRTGETTTTAEIMAPTDKLLHPFRWQFVPTESARDKSIHWTWQAYDHTGKLVMQADRNFETRAECVEDAVSRGCPPEA